MRSRATTGNRLWLGMQWRPGAWRIRRLGGLQGRLVKEERWNVRFGRRERKAFMGRRRRKEVGGGGGIDFGNGCNFSAALARFTWDVWARQGYGYIVDRSGYVEYHIMSGIQHGVEKN